MSELLLEIGCEEIPAGMLQPAVDSLRDYVVNQLKSGSLPFGAVTTYFTPRRLVLSIADMATKQPDQVEIVTGPPKSVSYDKDGQFTKAALSFAERNGVPTKALTVTTTPRGEYLSLSKKTKGVKTATLLASILPKAVASINFPKSMYWTEDRFRFARPIRWIVALLDSRVIPFSSAGLESGARTNGHRMLGRRQVRVPNHLRGYVDTLEKNFVVVDPAARHLSIRVGLDAAALQVDGKVLTDNELLDLVVNLNEFPTVIAGHIDEKFLSLPKEVLVTVMRSHQKYFSVLGAGEEMRPYFLTVINTDGDPHGAIRLGHERVLRARLADAQFFWETDRKRPLADRRDDLTHVLFQEKLGTYFDKTVRVTALARRIAGDLKLPAETVERIEQAASLAKVDLTTEMVKEFTDLQGVMGGLYARAEHYPEAVTQAIYDHYRPKNLEEASPAGIEGAILSIADKLDTIAGCFAVGLIPSGTRDPFALRRQGNGLLKVLVDHHLKVSLDRLIREAENRLSAAGILKAGPAMGMPALSEEPTLAPQLRPFFEDRLRHLMVQRGFRYDEINAVLAAGFDAPYEAMQRAKAVAKMRPESDFLAISIAFKRIKNILRDQPSEGEPAVNRALLVEEAEKALYHLFETTRPAVEALVAELDYYNALKRIAAMRQTVDFFFDKVLVMAPDADQRRNRLHLLRNMAALFKQVADISEIVVEKT